MTMATSMATSAKYHEAINIIDIERRTPSNDRLLEVTVDHMSLMNADEILFWFLTNDRIESVAAN
jgi:hypothetical protein